MARWLTHVLARVVRGLKRRVEPRKLRQCAVRSLLVEDLLREEALLEPCDSLQRHVWRGDRELWVLRARALMAIQPARRIHVPSEGDIVRGHVVIDRALRKRDGRPAAVIVEPVGRQPAGPEEIKRHSPDYDL